MTTGTDLIAGALRVVSSLSPGEAIPGEEADNALAVLNRMLKGWSASNQMIPFRTLESFPLVVGQNSYTIGPSANFNTVRPDQISFAWRRDANGIDYPLELIPQEVYDSRSLKSSTGLPYQLFYDPQFPNGVIYLFPSPSQADTLYLDTLKPIMQFTTISTSMTLPGEYEEAIVYLLAKRLAPEYGFSVAANPDVAALISDAETFIRRKNVSPKFARFDAALVTPPPFNIFNG